MRADLLIPRLRVSGRRFGPAAATTDPTELEVPALAQLTGTTERSRSHVPAAVVAATLLAIAVIATSIIVALSLGGELGLTAGTTAVQPRSGAATSTYDGRLDPIEDAYIRRTSTLGGPRVPSAVDQRTVPDGLPRFPSAAQ
jgi:hypothetical protein